MDAFRIMVLCIAAALVCASLRGIHPQIATAIALAVGLVAILATIDDIGAFSDTIENLGSIIESSGSDQLYLMKICGIAMVAEFASDICRDAGEAALAHRIDMAVKIGIVVSALPAAGRIMDRISELLI